MPSLAVTPMLLGSQVAIRVARAAVPNKSGAAVHGRGRSGMTRGPSGSPYGGRGARSWGGVIAACDAGIQGQLGM